MTERTDQLDPSVAALIKQVERNESLHGLIDRGKPQHSDTMAKLMASLSGAQTAIGPIPKNKTANAGPYSYKYADLADIKEAIRDPLAKNGLALFGSLDPSGDAQTFTLYLFHVSGEWCSTRVRLPHVQKWQDFGAALTYARRYAVSMLLDLATEDDTDAPATSSPSGKPAARPRQTRQAPPASQGPPPDDYDQRPQEERQEERQEGNQRPARQAQGDTGRSRGKARAQERATAAAEQKERAAPRKTAARKKAATKKKAGAKKAAAKPVSTEDPDYVPPASSPGSIKALWAANTRIGKDMGLESMGDRKRWMEEMCAELFGEPAEGGWSTKDLTQHQINQLQMHQHAQNGEVFDIPEAEQTAEDF